MSEIYKVEGGLGKLEVLHNFPDLPMWIRVPESENTNVECLDKRRYKVEYEPSKILQGPHGEIRAEGFYRVTLRRGSFTSMVSMLMKPLMEDGVGSYIEIESVGKVESERAAIYNVANELGIHVSVNKSGGSFRVTRVSEKGKRREPNWWTKVKSEKGHPVVLKFKGRLSSFRSKVYAWAKRQKRRVTVIPGGEPQTVIVTYHGDRESSKSNSEMFNELVDSLPFETPSELPEWLSSKSDSVIRVMCSNHVEPLSYKGGKLIRYGKPTATRPSRHRDNIDSVDSIGDFVYQGKNYGERSQKWVEIFMKRKEK